MIKKYYYLFCDICICACIIGGVMIIPGSSAFGRELCRAQLDCPPDFAGETVNVSQKVVMISEIFEHCAPIIVHEKDTNPDTISLFILIDHSGSMSVRDPTSRRYDAACQLIDSVARQSPKSEIGIAVFSNKLLHNSADDPVFEELTNTQGWNDSYVPFQQLDTQVGGMSAADKLKWAIELDPTQTDNIGTGNYLLVNGNYNNSGRDIYKGGTDVSLGFEAAKEAFKTAIYTKNRHYIILFSDGEAQKVDAERDPFINDYIEGKDVPTTFTAFFTETSQPIPNEIKNMTTNIKQNGYSANNIYSDVWKTSGEINEFCDKVFSNVTGNLLDTITSTPISLTINGVTTTTFDDTYAFFSPPLAPLDVNGQVTLDVSYTYHWNYPINEDTTAEFTVDIMHNVVDTGDAPTVDCWNQGTLLFFCEGDTLKEARPDQLQIDVHFFPPDSGNYPPIRDTFDVEISNSFGSDKLSLTMVREELGRYFEAVLIREYGSPTSGDGILQNGSNNDSIIGIYRNPDIPLDTVRHSIPVLAPLEMEIRKAFYLDTNANGYPDMIGALQMGGEVNSAEECERIRQYMEITGPRAINYIESIIPCPYGFDIFIPEPDLNSGLLPFTCLYYTGDNKINEKVHIEELDLPSSGQKFPYTDKEIQDSMAPVVVKGVYCPAYFKEEDQDIKDTLVVTFSEPVIDPSKFEVSPMTPFEFLSTKDSEPYQIFVKSIDKKPGAVQRFEVQSVELSDNSTWYPENGDSLWIDHEAGVKDTIKNIQKNENNRKGPLEVKPNNFDILVNVVPNPVLMEDFDSLEVLENVGIKGKKGMVIAVKVIGEWVNHIGLEGSLSIFDAVGNLVIKLEDGELIDDVEKKKKNDIKETLVFVWDGTNSYERKVGSGAYVAIITIESEQGVKRSQRIMLGVKEKKDLEY